MQAVYAVSCSNHIVQTKYTTLCSTITAHYRDRMESALQSGIIFDAVV